MKSKTNTLREILLSDGQQNVTETQRNTLSNILSIAETKYPRLAYHNINHALDVLGVVINYSKYYDLSANDSFILQTAAILHDVIVEPGRIDNEERSSDYASKLLPKFSYQDQQINMVNELILNTKLDFKLKGLTNPSTLLGQIMCDADLDNLGREDFFYNALLLAKENDSKLSYEGLSGFMGATVYWTEFAKMIREPKKIENITKLRDLTNEYLARGA